MVSGLDSRITKGAANIQKALNRLRANLDKNAAFVGIPSSKSDRAKDKGVSNAALLYVHSLGSPARNIPARPVLQPAVEAPDNRAKISRYLARYTQAVESGDTEGALRALRLAAVAGRNAAQMWLTDPRNGWPKLADTTVQAKLRTLTGKQLHEAVYAYARGEDPFQPLIDTGAMRKAITGLVNDEEVTK